MPGISREQLQDFLVVVVVRLAEHVGMSTTDYANEPELFQLARLVEARRAQAEWEAGAPERKQKDQDEYYRQQALEWQAQADERDRAARIAALAPKIPGAGRRLVHGQRS